MYLFCVPNFKLDPCSFIGCKKTKNKKKIQRNRENKILLTCISGLAGAIYFKFGM